MKANITKLEQKLRRVLQNQHTICHKGGKAGAMPRRLKYWLSEARKLGNRIRREYFRE